MCVAGVCFQIPARGADGHREKQCKAEPKKVCRWFTDGLQLACCVQAAGGGVCVSGCVGVGVGVCSRQLLVLGRSEFTVFSS